MDTQKEALWQFIDEQKGVLISTADDIYDHPEWEGKEVHAASLLTDLLRKWGLQWNLAWADFQPPFVHGTNMRKAGHPLAYYANMTHLRILVTAAAIISKDRP